MIINKARNAEIAQRLRLGDRPSQIARDMGLTLSVVSNVSRRRPRRTSRRPPRDVVMARAEVEAWNHGAPLASVLGPSLKPLAVKARQSSWLKILAETGCSIAGLAFVWGIDRQSIWRVCKRARAA